MPRRLWLLLVLVLAMGLSGCTDAPGGEQGPSGDDETGNDGGDGSGVGPFFGIDPGVEAVPLSADRPGMIEGQVFDLENGAALEQAKVTATCVRQALPEAGPDAGKTLPVGSDGTFALAESEGFAECTKIRYTIEAPGYTLTVPLESGPLVPGMQYLVHGGMTPDT